MMFICVVGMEWEVKAQNVLVVVILGAMANFLIGTLIGPRTDEAVAQGFTGFSCNIFSLPTKLLHNIFN